ncbi:MAG: hypothetical protein ACFUZC_00945 [Chthoniobacteraceae bacterium]
MNTKENGISDRKPYYLPASHAQNIVRYRQRCPEGDELLGIEALDYLVISVLQITGLSSPEIRILSVQADGAFPLVVSVENTTDFFSQTQYPLRIGYGASHSLLLNAPTASSDRIRQHCYPPKPREIVIDTDLGPVVFEAGE